ncbi:Piso0_001486 [Millerozyma farinosa CBS 7064]|uniref:Protein SQS1 n=1 Tax=Pichia sorbitophila (strain ATCC MYA-4447 / BCRC 22081 / CBS 7064 / NBRC 10061 / NRRL Y-12695) TaxID=559304 RepID=G8YKX4_PICSO|nr:Piso0_001486 [Millerozyma farinosa CBS 7064]
MVKRNGRRGGNGSFRSRGGRGRGGRSSRGGSRNGDFKGRKSSHKRKAGGVFPDIPDLMDLESNVYIPEVRDRKGPTRLRDLAKRPGRHTLFEEVGFTDHNIENTIRQPLRKRPIEFIKAKEVYDPGNFIFNKVQELEAKKATDSEVSDATPDVEENIDAVSSSSSSQVFSESDVKDTDKKEPAEVEMDTLESTFQDLATTPSHTEGKTEERSNFEDDITLDDSGDQTLIRSLKIEKPSTIDIISQRDESSHVYEKERNCLEYDPVLNIGKVSINTAPDLKEPKISSDEGSSDESDEEIEAHRDYIQSINRNDSSSEGEDVSSSDAESSEEEEDSPALDKSEKQYRRKDPEYGFLPEDYEFDVSLLEVKNVRFGLQNQYHAKCSELTGLQDEFEWIDEDDIVEFVLNNGVKEHRLESFLKYITRGMIDQTYKEQPNYSDVYISSSSEEDMEEEDDDDLETMLHYAKTSQKNSYDFDIPNTSLKTVGKGRHKTLDLDAYTLDDDIRESLQERYQSRRMSKASRKKEKEDARIEEALRTNDLLVKYPYTLHIREIKNEFDSFLHDASRESMSFPPLDPHGNKTLIKMASLYNLSSLRCGHPPKQYIKVSKNKRTFNYFVDHDRVKSVLRQRPVFNRTDQKKPREEKDKERQKNKSKGGPHVKEGDIVGGEAPEIDSNNIGRQLLEKLGWVKGEGLGTQGNKGISEPLVAKVKKSKTGLK